MAETKHEKTKHFSLKIYFVIVGLVLVSTGLLVYKNFRGIFEPESPRTVSLPEKLPKGITEDMILDKNATGFFNIAGGGEGRSEGAVKYVSLKTVQELYGSYLDYFTANRWDVAGREASSGFSFLLATKNEQKMEVTLSYNPKFNLTAVTLSLLK